MIGVPVVKIIFIMILRISCFFHFIDIYIDGKSNVGKTAYGLSEISAAAANYTCSHWILHSCTFAVKKEKPDSVKNILDEATNI